MLLGLSHSISKFCNHYSNFFYVMNILVDQGPLGLFPEPAKSKNIPYDTVY